MAVFEAKMFGLTWRHEVVVLTIVPSRPVQWRIVAAFSKAPLDLPTAHQNLNVYCKTGNIANWFQVLMVLVR